MIFELIWYTLLVFGLVSLFNLGRVMFKIRKIMKMQKDNPNIQGITVINGEVKVIEKDQPGPEMAMPKEMVVDPVCQKEIEKEDAYRVLKDGKEYYFCSWECREAFLSGKTEGEEGM